MSRRQDFLAAVRQAAAFALLCLVAATASAASVRSVGTSDLAARSNYVFHGKVVEKWVSAGTRPGSIVTNLRFDVLDVLKGARNRQSVTLTFLGGTLNGRTLRVEGLQVPAVGEEGVFFVERLGGNLIQPFYGWDQGRFLVRQDARGRKIVVTHDHQPVSRIEASVGAKGAASGQATGVVTSINERDALTVDAFKLRVRAMVEAQE